jgi:uncharacterized delta-60 repeat protein
VNFAVAKYSGDGELDTTYGTNGVAVIDFDGTANGGYHYALTAAFDAGGRLVVGGSARPDGPTQNAAFARLASDGSLDTAFGIGGMLTTTAIGTNASVTAMALQPGTNEIVAAGHYTSATGPSVLSPFVVRLTDAGAISETCRTRISELSTAWDQPNSMACDSSGNIYITCPAYNAAGDTYMYGVAKIKSDLSGLDTAFDTDGKVLRAVTTYGDDESFGIAVDSNNKAVVVGYVQGNNDVNPRYDEA